MCGKLVPVDGRASAASGSGVPHQGGAIAADAGDDPISAAASAAMSNENEMPIRRDKMPPLGNDGKFGPAPLGCGSNRLPSIRRYSEEVKRARTIPSCQESGSSFSAGSISPATSRNWNTVRKLLELAAE